MKLTGSSMDEHKVEQLEEANQQLQDSLKACHDLVAQYRSKLAAKGNDPLFPNESGHDFEAARSQSLPE